MGACWEGVRSGQLFATAPGESGHRSREVELPHPASSCPWLACLLQWLMSTPFMPPHHNSDFPAPHLMFLWDWDNLSTQPPPHKHTHTRTHLMFS